MSKEAVLAFMEKASTDTAIRGRVAALGPNDAAGLVQIAASAGCPVSVEELKGVLSSAEAAGELSDAAMQQVSGGMPPGPPTYPAGPPPDLEPLRQNQPGPHQGDHLRRRTLILPVLTILRSQFPGVTAGRGRDRGHRPPSTAR